MILNKFPSAVEFYKTYWGKKPFVVRGAIEASVFDELIDGESLAGLSLEEDIKSRIIMTATDKSEWTCLHGPFDEKRFQSLGDKNWSLLVQNVEQYHIETAQLLQWFNFAPRWLMDDIMVSYSEPQGSVGPHMDSYHVFLVQGCGRRQWTIGNSPVESAECFTDMNLKILKETVKGEEVEVSIGDVIYIPPHFAHEGVTLETAMTFSIGFLGPQLSDLLIEYGHYLAEQEENHTRYEGRNLTDDSARFNITNTTQNTVRNELVAALQSDSFSIWLAEYFSTPTYDDVENIRAREMALSTKEVANRLEAGEKVFRPEYVKLSITTSHDGSLNLAVYGTVVPTLAEHDKLIRWLDQNNGLSMKNIDALGNRDGLMAVITYLYNQNILFFEGEDLYTSAE